MPRLLVLPILLAAGRAGAPPPVSPFPSVILPADGSSPPQNTLLWAFGRDAPPVASLGFVLSVNGTVEATSVASLGCCLVRGNPETAFASGDSAIFTVSTATAELTSSFQPTAQVDTLPPALTVATLLDHAQGRLVIGVEGTDDRELAGFLARAAGGDAVISAAPTGNVLEAPAAPLACIDVVAVDLAGNESEPNSVCAPAEGEGEGEGEGAGEGGGCACTQGSAAPGAMALLALAWVGRRRIVARGRCP